MDNKGIDAPGAISRNQVNDRVMVEHLLIILLIPQNRIILKLVGLMIKDLLG